MPSPSPEGSPRVFSLASSLGRAAHAFLPRRHRTRKNEKSIPSCNAASTVGRRVTHVYASCRQLDADGHSIRRPSSAIHPSAFSPFLLLDHCGPHRISPGVSAGSEAPRCGQQALSYVVSGQLNYHDSCGNDYVLRPGHAHLLTAGSGLVVTNTIHSPSIEYLSVWINIPRDAKSAPPVQHVTEKPPSIIIGHGHSASRIGVLAGPARPSKTVDHHCDGHQRPLASSIELETAAGRAAVYDVRMNRKSQLVLNPETQRVFIYVYRGTAVIAKKNRVSEGAFALLEQDAQLPVVIDSSGVHTDTDEESDDDVTNFDIFHPHGCWCLVLAGDPIMEPVSMLPSGIVACTPQEIRKAFQEYTCGSMGAASPSTETPLVSRASLFLDSSNGSDVDSSNESDVDTGSNCEDTSIDGLTPDIGFVALEI